MKKFIGTYAMAVVAILLAAYTFWEFKHEREDQDAKNGERPAFALKREEINEIDLVQHGEKAVVKREGDGWRVVEPVQDLAEGPIVEGYLYTLLQQRVKTFRTDDEKGPVKWADFGLEPAATIITLAGNKGKAESLSVGTKHTFDGQSYVRQDDELLLGDKNLGQVAERPASSLRSRRLWRDDDVKITKATVEVPGSPAGRLVFAKHGDEWTMEPKPPFAFSPQRFEAWVNKVEEFVPSEFVKEGIDDQARHDNLLVKPSEVITFDFTKKDGTAAQWILTLGQDKAEDVFLFTNQRPTIYKSSKAAVSLVRVDKTYFRDGHSPFAFDLELAREVRIQSEKFNHKFIKSDSGWSTDEKDVKLDQDKLVQLMTVLKALEAQEFVSGSGTGFKSSSPRVEIYGDHGKLLFSLTWSDEYKAKSPWNVSTPLRYARTNVSHETLGVEKSKLDHLIDPNMVTKVTQAVPAKEPVKEKEAEGKPK